MTGARNLPALALYARFGFTEVRRVFRDEIELVFLTRM
jgi:ribosomal protein S18 acetylase RimI-like enzyme